MVFIKIKEDMLNAEEFKDKYTIDQRWQQHITDKSPNTWKASFTAIYSIIDRKTGLVVYSGMNNSRSLRLNMQKLYDGQDSIFTKFTDTFRNEFKKRGNYV